MNAKENIAKCADFCFSVLPTSGELIKIKAGEMDFYHCRNMSPTPEEVMKESGFESMDAFADELNGRMGVSPAVRQAMEMGSMFGWEVPGADPDQYNEDGSPKDVQ